MLYDEDDYMYFTDFDIVDFLNYSNLHGFNILVSLFGEQRMKATSGLERASFKDLEM